jgi:mannose-6-phosphate isomerase-like protein (cupin superfamily)
MNIFSITDNVVLCDTALCWAEVHQWPADTALTRVGQAPAEVALCVVEGELHLTTGDERVTLGPMQTVQIPAGWEWSAQTGASGARVLRVESYHPTFVPERSLMPALERLHRFDLAYDQWSVYTDWMRAGVLTFVPHHVAEKHFHQDADELFWFFQGDCRVTTADGPIHAPAGTIVLIPAGEWHIIENMNDERLLMFFAVTPNIVPSHTFFHPDGSPHVRSWEPLRTPPRAR